MNTSLKTKIYDYWIKNKLFFIAFVLPALIMWMIYIALEVYPFGSNSVLVLDLNGQYVYFFEDLRNKILNGGSFLYTWTRSLGGEFMGIFAYYLASPFSFLIALFSENHITEGLLLIILLKTGSMGATMAYYLNETLKTKKMNVLIFSTCYALSSYAVVMAHNTMWIDNLILLPLVTLGIERLIKKHDFKLFIVSLSLSLLTSFYIGYMTCLYVIIYFFYYYLAHDHNCENNFWLEDNHFWKSLLRITIYSAIAVSIAAVIIYPAYTSLQFGKSTFSTTQYEFTQRFDFLDFIVKLFPGSYDTVRPEGLPFVYCGIITVILVPIYFITSKIKWQERVMGGVILSFLFVCFNVSAIDIVWHGFQKPNWLNYRYSFMFIFLMLVMAYKAFSYIKFTSYKNIVFVAGAELILLMLIQKQDYEWIGDFECIWLSIVLLGIFAIALHLKYQKKHRANATSVIAMLVCVEMFVAGLLNTVALDDDVVISSRNSYNDKLNNYRPVVDFVKNYDTSPFYRMEKTFHRKTNDPMALNFYGISNSTSTLNSAVIDMLYRYGYSSKSNWTKYLGGTPVSDALLGIKYVLSDYAIDNGVFEQIHYDAEKNYYVYKNPYALSLAYASNISSVDFEITDYNSPFLLMNDLAAAITGSPDSIEMFKELEIISTDSVNIETGFASNHKKYSKKNSSSAARLNYTLQVKQGVPVYMRIPTDYPRECNLLVNGTSKGTYFGNETNRIVYLGTFDYDGNITVSLELKDDPIYIMLNQKNFFYLDTELFKSTFKKISDGNMNITSFEDTYIEGNINVSEENSLLYTSIVYDEGWTVCVDGEEQELLMTNDSLIAVEISAGYHEITFRYMPKCYVVGSAISICGILAFAGAIVLDEFKKRRENKRWIEINTV